VTKARFRSFAAIRHALVNATDPARAETTSKELQAAAHALGLQLHVLHASTERDFDYGLCKLGPTASRRACDRR
jgi:hypothetical protein